MKKLLVIVVIAVVALVAWMILKPKSTNAPANTTAQDSFDQELSAIELGDLESEFKTIDADLGSL